MTKPIDLKSRVLKRINASRPQSVWTAADFLDFATRDAVDKVLQRLANTGTLRRIDRGLYDKPALNSLTKAPNPPDPRQIIEAVARRDQIRVLVDGMTAANDLGLTNAVPAKIIVHTDSRLKPIRLENLEISFRVAAASKLFWAGRPAMRIVQALHWLRDTMSNASDDRTIRRKLQQILWQKPNGDKLRNDLLDGMSALPAWMQDYVRDLLAAGSKTA